MNQSRMYALDGARAVAAFSILLFHVARTRVTAFGSLYIAVDFFFVLSGFVLAPALARVSSIDDAIRFLISRFVRIFPMVLAIVLFTATYDLVIIVKHWVLGEEATSPIILSVSTILVSLLMLQIFYSPAILVDYPVWSLSAEWVANIAVAVIQVFTIRSKYVSLIIGAVLIITSGTYGSDLINQIGRAVWGFSIGLVAFDFRNNFSRFRKYIFLTGLLLVPIYLGAPDLGKYESLFSVVPFTALILILANLNTSEEASKLLAYMGRYSYGFYLWHFPILSAIGFSLNHFKFDPASSVSLALEIVLTSILSVLATKASLTLIEEPIRFYWGKTQK